MANTKKIDTLIAENLRHGESVLGTIYGTQRKLESRKVLSTRQQEIFLTAAVVATDSRVLVVGTRLGDRAVETMAYRDIVSVETGRIAAWTMSLLAGETLKVVTAGSEVFVGQIRKDAALSELADLIRSKSEEAHSAVAPAAQPAPTEDIPGQIAKLAELRDTGILTPEEFDAKKAELLARL